MSLDLNRLSMQQLKVELTQKGLELTGKKSELVSRLKAAMEGEVKEDNDGEDEMDTGDLEATDGEENKTDETERAKSKRWLHVIVHRKMNTRIKHLNVVQNMSARRKKKDIQTAVIQHRIRVFPLEPSDVGHPALIEIMRKCSSSSISFVPTTKDNSAQELKGLLVLNFRKKSDALDSISFFEKFREGCRIHHPTLDIDFGDYQTEWNLLHQGAEEQADNFLMLLPWVPDSMDEVEMWEKFPSAREIYICPKSKAKVKFGGKEEEQDQPAYAYIQFPNLNASQKDLDVLTEITPTDDMRKMCLIPVTKMFDWTKEDEEKAAKKAALKSGASTAASPKQAMNAQKPTQQAALKTKKALGIVAKAKGFQQNRSAMIQRRGFPQSRPGHSRGPRPMDRMMSELENVAAIRGPEEAQGIRLLNEMLSGMASMSGPRGRGRGRGMWNNDGTEEQWAQRPVGRGHEEPWAQRPAGRGNFPGYGGEGDHWATPRPAGRGGIMQGPRRNNAGDFPPKRELSPSVARNMSGGKRMRPDMSMAQGFYEEDAGYTDDGYQQRNTQRPNQYSYDDQAYEEDTSAGYRGSRYGGMGYGPRSGGY